MTEPAQHQTEEGPLPRTREAVDWWLDKWLAEGLIANKEPLTRQHVEKLIEVNGGTAEGLDLGGRDLHGADLVHANLSKANLADAKLKGATLRGSNLQEVFIPRADLRGSSLIHANLAGADLFQANLEKANLLQANLKGVNLELAILRDAQLVEAELQRANLLRAELQNGNLDHASLEGAALILTDLQGASFSGSNLQGVSLNFADLEGANFEGANLEGVSLHGAIIDRDTTKFRLARWSENMILGDELGKHWSQCLSPYRDLMQWHQHHGDYDTAGKFHYREWECKLAQEDHHWGEAAGMWIYRIANGYGEHWRRVIYSGASIIALFTLAYFPYSWPLCFQGECWIRLWEGIWQSLYFSGVSFTALGYGDFVTAPVGWTRYLGVVESLVGISLIALFLVTFTRKMTR